MNPDLVQALAVETQTKKALKVEAQQVIAACSTIHAMPVNTQADLDSLANGLIEMSARLKFLEEGRLKRTRPLEADLKNIRDETREVEAAYEALKKATNERITRYRQELRAAENKARVAALATQEHAHAAAAAGNLQAAAALQTAAFQAMTSAPPALETQGTHTRREWRIRVVNKAVVNPMWMIVDEKALTEHARKVLPKAAPDADTSAFKVNGVEVYLHEIEVVTGKAKNDA